MSHTYMYIYTFSYVKYYTCMYNIKHNFIYIQRLPSLVEEGFN